MKVAIFASGNGTNVEAIINSVKKGSLDIEIKTIISDQPHAAVIERMKKESIRYWASSYQALGGKKQWEQAVLNHLQSLEVELIILAGFMRILSPSFIQAYPKRILNIHPSLLPEFPGKNGIRDAFEANVKHTGVTIHWVDEGVDTGEIIAQESIEILPEWTLEDLEKAIHQIEHRLYSQTIRSVVKDLED